MPFETIDATLIGTHGTVVQFLPAGSNDREDVNVIVDDSIGPSGGALLSLFGHKTASGFSRVPVNNDSIYLEDVEYRVVSVVGPDPAGGMTISLTK